MKLLKFKDNFYKLIKNLDTNNGVETWLTDFGDKVFIYKNDLLSFDNNKFYKAEIISIDSEIADLFFNIKGG